MSIYKSSFIFRYEGGYMHIQGTKPDTLGYALNDSPMGLGSMFIYSSFKYHS